MAPAESTLNNGEVKKGLTAAQRLQMAQGAAGIYFFFIQYGKFQESIFKYKSADGKKFNAVWFMQLIDALANVLLALAGRAYEGSLSNSNLPQQLLAMSGLGQVMSKYCLSASLAAGLSFPVATLAKSAKMVPVMIGSLIFGGQTFSTRQISQAAAIVGGTSLVTLGEGSGKSGSNSAAGIAFVLAALGCDGLVGGVQKRLKVQCKAQNRKLGPYEMMFWTNFWMAVAAFAFASVKGELKSGMDYCKANPTIMKQLVKLGLCGAMGQAAIFYTISNFDSVVCTAVTTTRKLISVLISLAEGGGASKLGPIGWAGLGIASVGIMGEVA